MVNQAILCVPYYTPEDMRRREELVICLRSNVSIAGFSQIILMVDDDTSDADCKLHEKVVVERFDRRPTYLDWLNVAKRHARRGDLVVTANADIEFTAEFFLYAALELKSGKSLLAITRYEVEPDGSLRLRDNPHWTQDTWCIRADQIEEIGDSMEQSLNIPFGTPRCDNRLPYVFWLHGWNVLNPCHRIRTIHHQASAARAYSKLDTSILGGVAFVHPNSAISAPSEIDIEIFSLSAQTPQKLKYNDYLLDSQRVARKNRLPSASPFDGTAVVQDRLPTSHGRFDLSGSQVGLTVLIDPMFPTTTYTGSTLAEIIKTRLCQIYAKIGFFARHYDDVGLAKDIFWQYPAVTEKDAYLRHNQADSLCHVDVENFHVDLYFPFPWATLIDKKLNSRTEQLQIISRFVGGIAQLARDHGCTVSIHTVCQHIRWNEHLHTFSKVGITDLHLSHYDSAEDHSVDNISLHPWVLYAPNYEDPTRRAGLEFKPPASRRYLASFVGAYMPHYINRTRLALAAIASERMFIRLPDKWHFNDIVYQGQVKGLDGPKASSSVQDGAVVEYNRVISNSIFSLCPVGAGPNTLRFWESLAIGSIPVLFDQHFSIPFLDKFSLHCGRKVSDADIAVLVSSDDIPDLERRLAEVSDDERERMSSLGRQFYHFTRNILCFGKRPDTTLDTDEEQSSLTLVPLKVDFYRWPNPSFPFRLFLDHPRLRVFIIENIMHNWDWLSLCADNIESRDVFFVYCGWYHDQYFAETYLRILRYLRIPLGKFFIMYNSPQEERIFSKHGFHGQVINHNCWLDWNLVMKPVNVQKEYAAIYVARRSAFKRHMLASLVDNLALVAGNNHGNDVAPVPLHAYINDKPLSPEEVCLKINQSSCGLLLSETEGACFSSSEYLLCGVPVVSTKSNGGRDVWYNDYNSIIVDPEEVLVRDAVLAFSQDRRDPHTIRQAHIDLSIEHRNRFVAALDKLFRGHGVVELDAVQFFQDHYIHKLRGGSNLRQVLRLFGKS